VRQLHNKVLRVPKFPRGVYGYFHLYAKDQYSPSGHRRLGEKFKMDNLLFKKYPVVGAPWRAPMHRRIDGKKSVCPEEIDKITVRVTLRFTTDGPLV